MADKKELKANLITPLFRLSYPKLDVPVPYMENGKQKGDPAFSMQMIFEQDALTKFKRASEDGSFEDVSVKKVCMELVEGKWPGQKPEEVFPKNNKGKSQWPLKNGDKLIELENKKDKPKKLDHLAGMIMIPAKCNQDYPPKLSYKEAGKLIKLDRDIPSDMKIIKRLFSGGNYCIAELNIIPLEVNGNNYLTFYVNHVQFRKEGEAIGGSSLMDRFDGIDGGEADIDPTDDGDDL